MPEARRYLLPRIITVPKARQQPHHHYLRDSDKVERRVRTLLIHAWFRLGCCRKLDEAGGFSYCR